MSKNKEDLNVLETFSESDITFEELIIKYLISQFIKTGDIRWFVFF